MKTKKILLTIGLLLLTNFMVYAQENGPDIIPIPQQWQWHNGTTSISQLNTIVLGNGATSADHFTAEQIQEVLSHQYHVHVRIVRESGNKNTDHTIIIGDPNKSGLVRNYVKRSELTAKLDSAGYVMKIENNRVVIAAKTTRGRFYGAMSLKQLLKSSGGNALKDISITDYPSMQFRGVSDDMSRGQVSTEKNLEKVIRFIAEYKMNVYMPYIEDIIHIKQYPSIGRNRGAFTKKELRKLEAYAKKYHVQIIPSFETLGHQENILNNQKFVKYAEFPGAASFNTQSKVANKFLDQMLSDILPEFHSKYFSMGGDESFAVGLGASRAAVNRYGLATVNADYYSKVYDYIHKRGKKVMMYGDMLLRSPTTLSQIPKDIIIIDWHYGPHDEFPSTETFSRSHQPFVASPGINNWSRLYPNQSAAWVNTYYFTREAYQKGALGSITSSWGDMGGPNFREMNYRGYAYNAECSWNPENADKTTIDSRFDKIFFGTDQPELPAIQNMLNRVSEDMYYPNVWQQPFARLKSYEHSHHLSLLNETTDLERSCKTVVQLTKAIKPQLKYNADQMDYDAYAAKLAKWVANSTEFARWMQRISQDNITPESRKPYVSKGVAWGQKLRDQIVQLHKKYDELWMRTNRKDNLEYLDRLFKYQKIYMDQIVNSLKNNIWDTSYEIPSKFVAANGASGDHPIPKVYLRKRFYVQNKKIKHAYLQIAGDSYVKVWLNGHDIGKVMARRQGALRIDLRRTKYWDIAKKLNKDGRNVIAARAISYQQIPQSEKKSSVYHNDRSGAANIYLKIEYTDGTTQTIMTNQYWKSSTHKEDGWTKTNFDDVDWLPVTVVKGAETIYKPEFKYGLPSYVGL
ncbi:MAG TPA: glycoside hydrolase family 20 zincin-like fold domain-containing protein [Balneolales bacterium]|nr:glycoside hydrolase family 20 zincin-like fold domain-containing protein [Balneolales bacterium]